MPTTDDRTRAGLLDAIAAAPEDDGPRLVLADWLEEQGDPLGEFIRVQVELARLPSSVPIGHPLFGQLNERLGALRGRERELWDEWATPAIEKAMHADETWGGLPGIVSGHWPCGLSVKLPTEARYEFRRGFVGHVSLSLDAFMGEVCGRCDGGQHTTDTGGNVWQTDCHACHGIGYTGGLAAALGSLPLEAEGVRLVGCEPYADAGPDGNEWLWFRGHDPVAPPGTWGNLAGVEGGNILPPILFDLLTGEARPDGGWWVKSFVGDDHGEAAHAALARAACTLTRRWAWAGVGVPVPACPVCAGHGGHIYPHGGGCVASPANAMTHADYVAGAGQGWRVEVGADWRECPACKGQPARR